MKKILILLLCVWPFIAWAAPDAPVLSFEKQVEIVVAAKKNPQIFDVKLEQKKNMLAIHAVTDRAVTRKQAEKIAFDLVMLVKNRSLDDKPPNAKTIGTGLYTYNVTISRADGMPLVSAKKPAKKKALILDLPMLQEEPLTRSNRPKTGDATSQ